MSILRNGYVAILNLGVHIPGGGVWSSRKAVGDVAIRACLDRTGIADDMVHSLSGPLRWLHTMYAGHTFWPCSLT